MDHARFLRVTRITVAVGLLWAGTAAGEFRAAIAVRCVTPEPLLPVSGGVGPSSPTTKRMGDLTVRTLVLEQNGTRVAICSTDFLGFPGVLCEKVRAQVSHVPADNILIGATHTHSAPDCYGFPDEAGNTSCDLAYLDSGLRGAGAGDRHRSSGSPTCRGQDRHRSCSRQDRL